MRWRGRESDREVEEDEKVPLCRTADSSTSRAPVQPSFLSYTTVHTSLVFPRRRRPSPVRFILLPRWILPRSSHITCEVKRPCLAVKQILLVSAVDFAH